MRFINTITNDIINADEILRIGYENTDHGIFGYFYMKNGEKYPTFDMPDTFKIDGVKYEFCETCSQKIHDLLVKEIISLEQENFFYDIWLEEGSIWDSFIEWASLIRFNLIEFKEK